MKTSLVEEYFCEKHDYRTTDPIKAVKHIKGDFVDAVFDIAAKVVKAKMGIYE